MKRAKLNRKYRDRQQITENSIVTPGPGAYDVGLPLIKPSYEAIRKNNDVIILKVNSHSESVNFKSQQNRFPQDRNQSPGPGYYTIEKTNREKGIEAKKTSQRYLDLVEFMNRQRPKLTPIPNYKVEYSDQYEESIRMIKNSFRSQRKESMSKKQLKKRYKGNRASNSSLLSIQSKVRNQYDTIQSSYQVEKSANSSSKLRTIDYPVQKLDDESKKMYEEEKMLLHRQTIFNRNMLTLAFSKNRKNHELA